MPYTATNQVDSHRVRQGTILWLPPHDEAEAHLKARRRSLYAIFGVKHQPVEPSPRATDSPEFTRTMYEHPILVLSRTKERPEEIDFLLMTTLSDTTLEKYVAGLAAHRKESAMARYVPIEPSPRHPESGILLKYKYRTMPTRCGNVVLDGVYTMNWRETQLWWNGHSEWKNRLWQLDEDSVRQVLELAEDRCQYSLPSQYVLDCVEAETAWRLANPLTAWFSDKLEKPIDWMERSVEYLSDHLQSWRREMGVFFWFAMAFVAPNVLALLPLLVYLLSRVGKLLLIPTLPVIDHSTAMAWAFFAWEIDIVMGFVISTWVLFIESRHFHRLYDALLARRIRE